MTDNLGLLGLLILVTGILLEIIVYISNYLWNYRSKLAPFIVFITTFASGLLLFSSFHILWLVLGIVSIYRAVNLIRINQARAHAQHLRRACSATGHVLIAAQLSTIGLWVSFKIVDAKPGQVIFAIALSQVLAAVTVLISSLTNLKVSKAQALDRLSNSNLPAVSVAIPARNETTDLVECLESLLKSDYIKLEILVLDDCSHTKTSDIIRRFAQSGVRFIKGDEPKNGWLAKNQAYDRLVKASNGDLLLFCGVDLRVSPSTITQLVSLMRSKNLEMLSILPIFAKNPYQRAFLTPLVRWWELALPRFMLSQPAAARSSWLITKMALNKLGGFAAVHRSIFPEKYFARRLSWKDQYKFLISNRTLGLATVKTIHGQWRTAMRLRYFQTGRRPDTVAILGGAELLFLLGPFVMFTFSIVTKDALLSGLSGLSCAMLVITHQLIILKAQGNFSLLGLVNFPFIVIGEIWLVHASMWRYEFGEIIWKGRNICLPVMQIAPKLPPLPDNSKN